MHAVHSKQRRQSNMTILLPTLSAFLFTIPTRDARAETEQPESTTTTKTKFGDARNVVIGSDFSFRINRSHPNDDLTFTSLSFSPSINYFVVDHLSAGTALTISHQSTSSSGTN